MQTSTLHFNFGMILVYLYWGDPSHTTVLSPDFFYFLRRPIYALELHVASSNIAQRFFVANNSLRMTRSPSNQRRTQSYIWNSCSRGFQVICFFRLFAYCCRVYIDFWTLLEQLNRFKLTQCGAGSSAVLFSSFFSSFW